MEKIDNKIKALEWLLNNDINKKDKEIHKQALNILIQVREGKRGIDFRIILDNEK